MTSRPLKGGGKVVIGAARFSRLRSPRGLAYLKMAQKGKTLARRPLQLDQMTSNSPNTAVPNAGSDMSIDEYLRERLMPAEDAIPQLPGIDIYGNSIPAGTVGGDIFEYINFQPRYDLDARIQRLRHSFTRLFKIRRRPLAQMSEFAKLE